MNRGFLSIRFSACRDDRAETSTLPRPTSSLNADAPGSDDPWQAPRGVAEYRLKSPAQNKWKEIFSPRCYFIFFLFFFSLLSSTIETRRLLFADVRLKFFYTYLLILLTKKIIEWKTLISIICICILLLHLITNKSCFIYHQAKLKRKNVSVTYRF